MEAVTIHPPEGYEVCPTSTQTEIRFRPVVKGKPRWYDFKGVKGWYVNNWSNITCYGSDTTGANDTNRNVWPTKEEAEACLALSQLCQWRDKYNEGWKPDYTNCEINLKWTIQPYKNQVERFVTNNYPCILIFKTEEIRDKFLEDFAELIDIAKPLL
jgi:hypothetical protein